MLCFISDQIMTITIILLPLKYNLLPQPHIHLLIPPALWWWLLSHITWLSHQPHYLHDIWFTLPPCWRHLRASRNECLCLHVCVLIIWGSTLMTFSHNNLIYIFAAMFAILKQLNWNLTIWQDFILCFSYDSWWVLILKKCDFLFALLDNRLSCDK